MEKTKTDSQCTNCNKSKPESNFIGKNGKRTKNCQKCRNSYIKSKNKRKCEHNKQRNLCKECGGRSICENNKHRNICKECGGTSICEHNKQRSLCKECGGSSICEHNRERSYCKECGNSIKITIKCMIKGSKQKDKISNIYDENNFIDKCFLEELVEEYTHCYWSDCKIELQFVKYQEDLATIERLNNTIGHTKANCVLACLKCNHMKKSNRTLVIQIGNP
jgi:hypothetical protein